MEKINYSERIAHNEKRIAELKGKIYTDKLTVKSLENENQRCFEAMNNLTSPIDTEKDKKDKKIFELTAELDEAKKTIKKLKKEKKQLKVKSQYLSAKLDELEKQDTNIFEELAGKPGRDIMEGIK